MGAIISCCQPGLQAGVPTDAVPLPVLDGSVAPYYHFVGTPPTDPNVCFELPVNAPPVFVMAQLTRTITVLKPGFGERGDWAGAPASGAHVSNGFTGTVFLFNTRRVAQRGAFSMTLRVLDHPHPLAGGAVSILEVFEQPDEPAKSVLRVTSRVETPMPAGFFRYIVTRIYSEITFAAEQLYASARVAPEVIFTKRKDTPREDLMYDY